MWWLIRSALIWGVGSAVIVAWFNLSLIILGIISGFTILVTVIWGATSHGRHATISHMGGLLIIPALVGINAGMLVGYVLN